uniref:DNA-directed RNA polymerase subunit beta' n=1 Tax=Lyticum sinuosum TaxID=1332059 RepID=UPI003898E7B6
MSLASPETIEKIWSHGEVKLPDTINYRTAKPERGGMFCAAIFGPIKDYECLCGKYKRMKYRGIICEKCGVEVTVSQKRRRRMAHIKLASPVVHIWFLRSLPSRISTLLDISLKDVERVLYFNVYIVSNPGLSHFQYGQIINDDEYHNALNQYGEGTFEAGMGANIIRKMLEEFNLHENRTILREELINCNSEIKRKKIVRRLRLIEDFIDSGVKPEWMVLTVLPVIPPDLRPLVMLDGGRFATSDLNELYRRVINRNNRLKRLLELKAPEVIVHNEMRMLQESVDALLDNGRRGKTVTTTNKRPLKSLADMLKGKQGRFRQNLLGKRVDYSGRSVIIAGPHLKLNQCGLPKKMALELFKPFVYARLEKRQIAITISAAKKIVEAETPEVWDILREVTREHPVLLNRAPTLHRLGIQAFEPILIDGMAIQLHPLVCTAFNADFDGDQMAVHIPLSPEAQSEARILMASTKNILSPANGKPIIVPSQDIIQGLYYLTIELPGQKGEGMIFASFAEVEYAVFFKLLDISARIKCRYKILDLDGKYVTRLIETTAGRLIFAEALPENCKIRFDQINKQMNKKEVSNLIESVYKNSGQKNTVKFADNIMQLGFKYACKSGLSFGKDDMVVPHTKTKHVNDAKEEVKQYEMQYSDGLITSGERYNKVVDTWSRCTDLIGSDVLKYISLNKNGYPIKNVSEINSIFMMADSGARGSAAQIRQLAGMRGLMTKPSGEIIETPIVSNFREGLSVYEYFNSTHGTRKGLADTALKTANSGYLTRKLVDVSQDCIVITDDCNTDKSITVGVVMENGEIVVPLRDRILGRVAAIDIYYPIQDKLVIKKNEVIDEKVIDILEEAGIDSIKVRSPIMCDTKGGICVKCYGRDLSNGKLVKIGTAVGIIAAQSIGEPGTQLTMRTFHIGGAAQKAVLQSSAIAAHGGILRLSHKNIVIDSKENKIVMSRNCEAIIIDEKGCEITRCKLPYGSSLLFDEYDNIKIGAKLAEWDPFTIPVITEKTGIISLVDLIKDVSVKEVIDEVTGMTSYVVMDSKSYKKTAGDLHPSIVLQDQDGKVLILANGMEAKYHLPVNAILSVKDKDNVNAGDIIARIPKESSKSRDITGGLPRVVEMFEARYPKDHSIISEIDGYVEFTKDYKSKRHIIIRSDTNPDHFVEYFIARGHNITVQDGDYVKRGYLLMEGSPSPHEILRIMGVEALTHHIVEEVQQVYRLQGVNISDIHIEVIVKQMLRKVEITRPNGTVFLEGEKVDREEFEEINRKTIALGYEPAECMWVLQGITKSSLQTSSFLAAASFQETTRVITNAALAGKTDELRGLKENVIVGKLVPSGSGYCFMKVKDQALIRDREVRKKLEEQIKDEKLQESIDKLENDNEISVASS